MSVLQASKDIDGEPKNVLRIRTSGINSIAPWRASEIWGLSQLDIRQRSFESVQHLGIDLRCFDYFHVVLRWHSRTFLNLCRLGLTETMTEIVKTQDKQLSPVQALNLARRYKADGNVTRAENIYRQILKAAPEYHAAYHEFGLLAVRVSRV